jgi:hypothetical protein
LLPGGASLVETGTAEQFQTEISRKPLIRKFRAHIGHCDMCGRRARFIRVNGDGLPVV